MSQQKGSTVQPDKRVPVNHNLMDEQAKQSQPVKVKIHGQEYPIRARGDEDYIKRVARYVDERMSLIEEQTSVNSSTRLAILAALNIADELFSVQSEKEQLLSMFEKRARKISEFLDKNIDDE